MIRSHLRDVQVALVIILLIIDTAVAVNVGASAQEPDQANMSVNPQLITLVPGQSAEALVTISSPVEDNFTLYATGLPIYVGVRFDPTLLHVDANQSRVSNLTLVAGLDWDQAATVNNFTLTIGATGLRTFVASSIAVTLPPCADLVLYRIWTDPARPRTSDQTFFHASIGNKGPCAALDFRIDFLLDEIPFDSVFISQLGVDQQVELISTKTWPAALGNHTLHVNVDAESQVADPDRSNNVSSLDVIVGLEYYTVYLVVDPSLEAPAHLKIDGKENATIIGGQSYRLRFASGTGHDVDVPAILSVGEGTRYVTSDHIRHFDSGENWRVSYHKQFLLVSSANVQVGVECLMSEWHEAGEEVPLSSLKICETYPVGEATVSDPKFELVSKNIDGRGFAGQLIMDSPHEIHLEYIAEYYLNVISDFGTVACDGNKWHAYGSHVVWCVTPREIQAPGLWGYLGLTLSADTSNNSLTITKPETIDVEWNPNYLQLFFYLFFASVVLSGVSWVVHKGLDNLWRRRSS
jgi:hypothetical protein